MNNIIGGIIISVICIIGYFYAFKFQRKNQYFYALLLLIVCGFGLRLYTSLDFFLHVWDERYHALVSKNLINNPLTPLLYKNPILPFDYQNWSGNHIWVHKQPFPLWIMSGSLYLFGYNEIALRLPSILLTTIGIWLTFEIGSKLFTKKIGFFAAFLYSINGLIVEITAGRVATDHPDVFFLFFIELAIYFSILFAEKNKILFNILAGLSLGAAILSKWLPALIVLPIWGLLQLNFNKHSFYKLIGHFILLISVCTLIFLPWQIYIYSNFPLEAAYEASFNMKHITTALEGQTGPFYYFFDKIRINYGDLIYLPLIWFFYLIYKDITNKKYLLLLIWFLVPILFFSIAKTKMQGYILFTAPALFIVTAIFYVHVCENVFYEKYKWLNKLVLILLIALPARYALERVKPFDNRERNPQWAIDLKNLAKNDIQKGVMFNYPEQIEAMFYTNLTVYAALPSKELINELIEKGYTVIINQTNTIPNELKNINGVQYENLAIKTD